MEIINRKYVNILGIDLTGTPRESLLRLIQSRIAKFRQSEANLSLKEKLFIVTLNPEQLILAQKDSEFKKIINSSDIKIPDGVGLLAADYFLKQPNYKNKIIRFLFLLFQGIFVGIAILLKRKWLEKDFQIIRGREFFIELIKLANKKGWRVYFLGGKKNVSETVQKKFEQSYKKIRIKSSSGPILNNFGLTVGDEDRVEEKRVVEEINNFRPHLLFVAYGAPKQEKWLYRWLSNLKIGVGMVVGGTFDYLAGTAKLPPKWMSDAGLEWLWRVVQEPERIIRIITAIIIFPLKIFIYKLQK